MLPRAKKSFGQNFLVDKTAVQKIIQAAEIKKGETVFEIGPGTGTLTQALVDTGARVIAIETDKDLIAPLQKRFGNRIELIHGDTLSDLSVLSDLSDLSFKLVANIPYNITSPILERFLTTSPRPSRMILMVQKEVADRITAKPPKMSLLSIVCQIYAKCKRIAIVKAGAFRPIPKVDSAIIRLDLYKQSHPGLHDVDPETIIALAKRGFSSKRKQLKTNLGFDFEEKLKQLGLDPKIRAEGLTVENWINLSLILSW
ncbi:ribosomal RNA small subunit methyltransferase A [Candidatus Uhrbacteria bacterium]|nr:ribosomal RNA small subunit methyltransferase A [Candidatus Uhrbacteria bacterium]